VADWDTADIVALLRNGTSPRASVMGPMADVVWRSTQHWDPADLAAVADYLKALPEAAAPDDKAPRTTTPRRDAATMARGAAIYDQRCAYCHGAQGEGAPGAYPPLAGNRAVTLASTTNLVMAVRHGGFLPATQGNPRPHGMPPFGHVLDDADIAAVLSYVRGSWGNDAPPVPLGEAMRR
jgi:mono/diheme cytochrome c family protein